MFKVKSQEREDKLYMWLSLILSWVCISRLGMDQATHGRIITAVGRKTQSKAATVPMENST